MERPSNCNYSMLMAVIVTREASSLREARRTKDRLGWSEANRKVAGGSRQNAV